MTTTTMLDDSTPTRKHKRNKELALSKALLGVVLAFPLGILSALTTAISLFATIVPISVLLGLVFPIVIPLVVVAGALFGSWQLAQAISRILLHAGAAFASLGARVVRPVLYAADIAYMGLYGAFVLARSKSPEPTAAPVRATRLFISNMPRAASFVYLPTPPLSSPSYTPSRSPTLTECTDTSLLTPVDEPSYAQFSDTLHTLNDRELEVVGSYVTILGKGRENLALVD